MSECTTSVLHRKAFASQTPSEVMTSPEMHRYFTRKVKILHDDFHNPIIPIEIAVRLVPLQV